MSIRGIFASHSGIVGERVGDIASRVLMLGYTGTAPLLALSSGMPKEGVVDTSYSWVEDSHISGNTQATGNVNTAVTTIPVEDANIWTKNTIIMNQTTGEYMLITAINSDTSVEVLRAIGATTAQNITTGDRLQHIGSAYAEGSGKPDPVTQKGENRTNYVQIFKNGWAVTGTAKAVKFHTGSQLAYNRQQALGYHLEDLEKSFIFGRPTVRHINGQQLRISAGIRYQIATYGGLVESANAGGAGQMNLDGIFSFMRRIFDRNVKGMPNERISFTGSGTLELIQQMVRKDTQYNITQGEDKYGIKVMKLTGFSGDLTLASHPLFTENSAWGKELLVLHPGLIKKRVLRESWEETFNTTQSNTNGDDKEEGYIGIELGWQAQAVETMGYMTNITTAVASPV
ncbi:major capsid protein [Biomphalaria pfeifferi]|uniref:Major capsid protein n=1 Tax=Biomphalaria pfeifferi TaxID=112525 RepID=A0AAD8AQ35_BIOPF|nr:major capsid protein [Biomphalaria pfeifferi]